MQNLKTKKIFGVPVIALVAGVMLLGGVAYAAWAVFLNTTGSVTTATVTAEYVGMDSNTGCTATASGQTLAITWSDPAFPGSECSISPRVRNTGTATLKVQGFQGVPTGIDASLPTACGAIVDTGSLGSVVRQVLTVNDTAPQGTNIDLSTLKLHLVLEQDYVAADCPVAAA